MASFTKLNDDNIVVAVLEVHDDEIIEITWREYFNDALQKLENARIKVVL